MNEVDGMDEVDKGIQPQLMHNFDDLEEADEDEDDVPSRLNTPNRLTADCLVSLFMILLFPALQSSPVFQYFLTQP